MSLHLIHISLSLPPSCCKSIEVAEEIYSCSSHFFRFSFLFVSFLLDSLVTLVDFRCELYCRLYYGSLWYPTTTDHQCMWIAGVSQVCWVVSTRISLWPTLPYSGDPLLKSKRPHSELRTASRNVMWSSSLWRASFFASTLCKSYSRYLEVFAKLVLWLDCVYLQSEFFSQSFFLGRRFVQRFPGKVFYCIQLIFVQQQRQIKRERRRIFNWSIVDSSLQGLCSTISGDGIRVAVSR